MSTAGLLGTCDVCAKTFPYSITHNGFNESAYAYCAACGMTALLSGWTDDIPPAAGLRLHERITESVEPFLSPCSCGGRFTARAAPRCPHCQAELSATKAGVYLEHNAPGTRAGWRWQGNWSGLYAIVIDGRVILDNWLHRVVPGRATI